MKLFEESKINQLVLKNRFFKAATWEDLATKDGHMTEELFNVYKELAEGGVGTILTGYAYVTKNEQPNPGMMGIYDDSFIEDYKELTNMVHKNNSNIIMQIVYGGSMSTLNPPSKKIFGASSIENERTKITPTEISKEEIKELEKAYIDAALRVKKAGFDGVEIHSAHGYFLSQILSPYYNQRTDEYGGSIENRGRMIIDIVKGIREAVGPDFPILMKLNSEDFMGDKGLSSEESIALSIILEEAGLDGIEVSGGNESSLDVLNNNLGPARRKVLSKDKEAYFLEHGKKLSKAVNIPVILTGGLRSYDFMDEILDTTDIKYFGIGRPLICEPDLINTWENGNIKKAKCVSCNKCYQTHGKRCIFNV